jgi:membrane protein
MDQLVQDGTQRQASADAGKPAEPAPGWRRWRDVAIAVGKGVSTNRIFLIAAGVTFYAILALFPAITALVSIYGLFANPGKIAGHLDTLAGVAPGGAVDVIRDQLTRLASQNGAALGLGFLVSLVAALWFSNSGMTALFDALNVVYEEQERRGLVRYYASTLMFTAGAIVLVLASIAIIVAIPIAMNYIPNASVTAILLAIVRWPLLVALATTALAIVYRWGPFRSAPQWRWIWLSAVAAALVWLAVSALFSWYVSNFGSYNRTYGSLGAIFGFMTWMWLSMVVVLVGAKLDAELERRFPRQQRRSASPP